VAHELKLDGYPALAIKTNGQVRLRSRNNGDFNAKYPRIAKAFSSMPDETVINGEVVALDEAGRPSFNALQNHGSSQVFYDVFDVLVLGGRSVTAETLAHPEVESAPCRRRLLRALGRARAVSLRTQLTALFSKAALTTRIEPERH
jgi:ATP-dependent DNA ligase